MATISQEELKELLTICFKEQGFKNCSVVNNISNSVYLDRSDLLKLQLESMGKALIEASKYIK